jgi:hypothetical protein
MLKTIFVVVVISDNPNGSAATGVAFGASPFAPSSLKLIDAHRLRFSASGIFFSPSSPGGRAYGRILGLKSDRSSAPPSIRFCNRSWFRAPCIRSCAAQKYSEQAVLAIGNPTD